MSTLVIIGTMVGVSARERYFRIRVFGLAVTNQGVGLTNRGVSHVRGSQYTRLRDGCSVDLISISNKLPVDSFVQILVN